MTAKELIHKAQSTGIDFGDTPVITLLLAIRQGKFSGIATFQKDKVVRKVAFSGGHPATISSNLRGETLAPLLLSLKKISDSEAEKLTQLAAAGKQTPAALLGQLGRLTQGEIDDLVLMLQHERLKALLSLKGGSGKIAPQTSKSPPIRDYMRAYFDGISKFYDASYIEQNFTNVKKENYIIYDEELYDSLNDMPFSPEEKGIATIASGAERVEQIYKDSLLEPIEITQNILKLNLLSIIRLEDAVTREERLLEASLTPEQKTLRHEVQSMLNQSEQGTDYFNLLKLKRTAVRSEIDKRFGELLQTFPADKLAPLFTKANQQKVRDLGELLRKIHGILTDDKKREEYVNFLNAGGTGAFEGQSKTIGVEKTLDQGCKLFQAGDYAKAHQVFEASLKDFPNEPVLLSWAGLALYKTGSANEKAKATLNEALNKAPELVEPNLYLGEIALGEGQQDTAMKHLKNVLLNSPKHPRAKELLRTIDEEVATEIEIDALNTNLDKLDYYVLLDIPRDAKRVDIQKAFHARTKQFHPDRFFTHQNASLRSKAGTLYKRAVEAYMVLKSPFKRQEYDSQLVDVQDGKQSVVRLKDAGDVVQKKERSDIQIANPQAKKFYTLAITCIRQNNRSGAIMNLKMALGADPNNEIIQKKLAEVQGQGKM